ncbi:MAG TPA: cardiolipin synthase [Burkholderiales bacterium]|nr:cardiolipin synthase [Burkholderiales bacterium]
MRIKPLLRYAAVALGVGGLVLLVANLALGDKRIDTQVEHLYPASSPQFRRAMDSLLGPGLVDGNRARALVNGREIFPQMLKAIREAKKTITFEMYIFAAGEVGEAFTQAFEERARAGVKIHFLYDAIGSGKIDAVYLERLRAAGVEIASYNPVRWYTLARMNNRTHRKLMVVDGRVGFTGGAGIQDEWAGDAHSPEHWRDTHFRIEGPAVAQMQAAFMENWIETTGKVLHGEDYFPKIEPATGNQAGQVVVSSPGGGGESMQLLYLLSIASAAKSIQLANAYFVPDGVEIRTLAAAAKRGVKVQVLVPGPLIDNKYVRRASRASWGDLLRAGVEIYEFQPAMFHVKSMVVDDLWATVGSTNFDTRSFSTNDEANLNILDPGFAAEQRRIFEADLKRARRITLEEWQSRPWTQKAWDSVMDLLSSQL